MDRKLAKSEIDRCYAVLELKSDASPQAVKEAWRDLIKVWHPDRFTNDPRLQEKGHARLKEFNHARKILEDHLTPARRPRHPSGWNAEEPRSRLRWLRRPSVIVLALGAMLMVIVGAGARLSMGTSLSATDLFRAFETGSERSAVAADDADRSLQLVALGAVQVTAYAVSDGQVLLAETMMAAGQTIGLCADGAIYLKYSAGENLQILINGTRYSMPTRGLDRAKINPASR